MNMFEGTSRELTVGGAEVRAFLHAVAPHMVAVLPPGGDIGTGTLVRWKSSAVILTANHNLDGTKPSDVRFCFYPGGTLHDGPMSTDSPGPLHRGLAVPVEDEVIADGVNDIVVIRLKSIDLPQQAQFYDLLMPAPLLNEGCTVVLAGFAGDNCIPLPNSSRGVGVTVQSGRFDTALNSRKDLSVKYNKTDHFLLPFTRLDDGVRPYGISGAAAWCNAGRDSDVWAAHPVLAGVQTSWYPKSKLLQIVRMDPVISLLNEL